MAGLACAFALALLWSAPALAAARASASSPTSGVAGPAASQLLYVLEANEGWATKRADGHWRLTLRGLARHVLAFADRPARSSRELPTRQFVGSWAHMFGSEAPNAAIVSAHGPRGESPTGVEIFKASWEGPHQLSVCMCMLGSRSSRWLSELTRASAHRHGPIRLLIAGPRRHAPRRNGRSRVELMYVLQAMRGWIEQRGDGESRLILPGVFSDALSFSTQPARVALPVASTTLLRSWRMLFAAKPPNAALVAAHSPRSAPLSLELRRPRMLAGGGASFGVGHLSAEAAKRLSRSSAGGRGEITLFIDDAGDGASFSSPGEYSYTVPSGVSSVFVQSAGAGAEGSGSAPSSAGGDASGLFAVTPGQTLRISIGAPGTAGAGGAPDGGAPGESDEPGPSGVCRAGGGGGSTRLSAGKTTLLVAGGGAGYSEIGVAGVTLDRFQQPMGGYDCSIEQTVAGASAGGGRIGGAPPGAGTAGDASGLSIDCSSFVCANAELESWSLNGGGGGGGGAGGTAFAVSGGFGAGSFTTAGTSWIASTASMAEFGTAGEADANGSLAILPIAGG